MPTPLMQKIAIAAETGYEGIELWHDDLEKYLQEGGQLHDVRKALDDAGLTVPTTIMVKGWFDTHGAVHDRGMSECRRRFEQAAEVGARQTIAGPALGIVDLAAGAIRYGELMEVGSEYGVLPAMEFLGFAADVNQIEHALSIITNCGRKDGTIVLDPFHVYRGGGEMETIAQLRAEQIAISHFNDTPAFPPRRLQHDCDRIYPGEGIINLTRYTQLLRSVGYDGWLSLELFNRQLWAQDPNDVARIGLEKMRAAAEG